MVMIEICVHAHTHRHTHTHTHTCANTCAHLFLLFVFRLFNFTNTDRGTIEFKGNMLFTHFSEINSPKIGNNEITGLTGPLSDSAPHNDLPDESGKQ